MSLIISQAENTAEQNIPAGVIEKLYNLTFTTVGGVETLRQDAPTTLIGTVSLAGPTYQEYVTSLTTQYSQFHVNGNGYYVLFEDPIVKQLCATTWGDGTGVTTAQLGSVSKIKPSPFKGNTNIVKFNEFQYFTGLTSQTYNDWLNNDDGFYGCTNLEEITLPSNLPSIPIGAFSGCTSLKTLHKTDLGDIQVSGRAFRDCYNLEGQIHVRNIGTYQLTYGDYGGKVFHNCSKLTKITIGDIDPNDGNRGPTTLQLTGAIFGDRTRAFFYGLNSLKILEFGPSLTSWGGCMFANSTGYGCNSLKALIFHSTTPPSVNMSDYSTAANWGNSNVVVYVPASALSAYQSASGFSDLGSTRLKTIENDYNEATILAS